METRSLKALSLLRLYGNSEGNSMETKSFHDRVINRQKTDPKETFSEHGFLVSATGNFEGTMQSPNGKIDDAEGNSGEKFPKSFLPRKPLLDNNNNKLSEKVSGFHGVAGNRGNQETADTLDEILRRAILEIDAGRIWNPTAQVRELETTIDQIYRDVLAGSKTVEDFKGEVLRWKLAGTRQPETKTDGSEWNETMKELIGWFEAASLPEEPFSINSYEHILQPATYYIALRRDIEAGPSGPRARFGALQGDLQRLRDYCERRVV